MALTGNQLMIERKRNYSVEIWLNTSIAVLLTKVRVIMKIENDLEKENRDPITLETVDDLCCVVEVSQIFLTLPYIRPFDSVVHVRRPLQKIAGKVTPSLQVKTLRLVLKHH